MTKSRRFLLLILVILTILVSCKPQAVNFHPATEIVRTSTAVPSKVATKTQVPKPTATAVPTAEPLLEKLGSQLHGIELVVQHPWYGEAEAGFNAMVDAFNQENDYEIKVSTVGGFGLEYMADLLSHEALNANLVIAQSYDFYSAHENNRFINLSAFFNDTDLGISDFYDKSSPFDDFNPLQGDAHSRSIAIAYQPALLYYNKSWAEELGFDEIPLDFESFTSQMMAGLAANLRDDNLNNNGTGGLLLSKSVQSALAWYFGFDGSFNPGSSHLQFDEDPLLNSYEWLKTAFEKDAHWVGMESVPYEYFARRLALAAEGGLDDLAYMTAAMNSNEDDWMTMPYPSLDGRGVIAIESLGIGILNADEPTELASWIFTRYLLEEAQQAALVEVHGYWPVTGAPTKIAPDYAEAHPAWASSALTDAHYILAPEAENWAITRRIFQDAYLRVYGLDTQYLPKILGLLKQTLIDVQRSADD